MKNKRANSHPSRGDAGKPITTAGRHSVSETQYILGKCRRKTLAFLFLATLTGPLLGASATGFEPGEGFTPDSDMTTKAGWTKSAAGAAKVSEAEAQGGSQSLEVPASKIDHAVNVDFAIPGDGIVFIDFAIRPAADASNSPAGIVDANGAVIGFLKNQDQGSVVVVSSPAKSEEISNSVDTGFTFPLNEQREAADWIRITVREDLTAQKWDLYLDGKLTLIDQLLHSAAPAKSNTGSLAIYSSPAGGSFVDDLSITGANPLFADADKDGIPDAMENAMGGNAFLNERAFPSAAQSPIERFLEISSGAISKIQNVLHVIYVDNTRGNDQSTGELSYPSEGRGPKATLIAAIEESETEDIYLAIASSKAPYKYRSNSKLKGKTIHFLPQGDVTIGD